MSDDPALFRARAEAEAANARESTLANVKERCTRAAEAWTAMAVRAERTGVQRREREAAAAARILQNAAQD